MVTIPALKAIADEVAGGDFDVVALSKGDQDVHSVSPTPSLMKKVREAALFVEIGLQLEIWADEVANGSGNPDVQRSGKFRVVASAGIPREEVPAAGDVTRAKGDVHPDGNPHIWLDPLRTKAIAENIAAGLRKYDGSRAAAIDERAKAYASRIDEAVFGAELVKEVGGKALTRKAAEGTLWTYLEEKKLADKVGGWLKKAQPLRGQKVIEYHKSWVYLGKLLGFEIVGSIQPLPGIEPGPRHLQELRDLIKSKGVKILICDNYYNVSLARSIASDTGTKAVVIPSQPYGEKGTETYFKFIDHVLDQMLEALK
jgi:ABC-type Zn uptake system ZnuABC Zn-binding protein ZnuA